MNHNDEAEINANSTNQERASNEDDTTDTDKNASNIARRGHKTRKDKPAIQNLSIVKIANNHITT
jgi:hypothetical protein